jgi:ketosteroid isomerase-like protein
MEFFESEGKDMAGELEAIVRETFAALDRKDFACVVRTFGDEVQAVDEISRRWMRNHEEISVYVRQLETAIEDIHSELRDVHEKSWGDTGLVTCWLEQDYTLEGQRQHVSAPTSVGLRREGSRWQIVLLHSIPLPEGRSSK